jgi:ankyrin repeat protein
MLIARGADVNAKDSWRGQTALMWAAAENHAALMRVLLAGGAAVDAKSNGNFTALMFAVRQDARDAARLLIEAGADVNVTGPNGQDVLRMAISNRHYTLAAALLDAGARPVTRDKQGTTPLHELVTSRSPARHLGNQFIASGDDESPQLSSLDLMKKLVAHGADPNARTEPRPIVHERWTDKGIYSAARPFMDNGVNLGGATPYLLAAQAADVEGMQALQALGADPRIATYANNTAVMLAAGIGHVEGSRRYRPERDALEAVKLAATAGVDVNASNANGQTAMHGAVYRAANSIIRYLVEAGARTDFQDELERTPLKLAEQGFNQVASLIRRDAAAALLKELGATLGPPARTAPMPDVQD